MELESGSGQCGLCCMRTEKLSTLSAQEQLLLKKRFQCMSLHNASSKYACDLCWNKLCNFEDFLREIIYNLVKLEKTNERKMQEDLAPDQIQEETITEEEVPHFDSYNCKCTNCLTKFGSLPLLVDVIENEEKKTEEANEPKPSTSKDLSPKGTRKTMKCNHCEKMFTHKGDLNKHTRKHTGEQPYTCKICDRKFAHNSNLTRHSRLHSGDRPFKCDVCNKEFSRKDKLELHRKSKFCRTSQ